MIGYESECEPVTNLRRRNNDLNPFQPESSIRGEGIAVEEVHKQRYPPPRIRPRQQEEALAHMRS